MSGRNTPRAQTPRAVATAAVGAPPHAANDSSSQQQQQRLALLESRASTSEETFQRILRKLQREENFGAAATGSVAAPSASLGGGAAAAMLAAASVKQPGSPSSPTGGGAGESLTLDQRMRRAALQDEESRFGVDPNPSTLRSVVEQVRASVEQKLELATISPVRDTMKLIFECRTLLDKLLKDIPSHGNVVDVDGRSRAGPATAVGGTSATPALPPVPGAAGMQRRHMTNVVNFKELFQEFKQTPVHLPAARYGLDEGTGKVVPVLVPKPPAVITGRPRSDGISPTQPGPSGEGGGATSFDGLGGSSGAENGSGARSSDALVTAVEALQSSLTFTNAAMSPTAPATAPGGRRIPNASAAAASITSPTNVPLTNQDHLLLLKYLRRQAFAPHDATHGLAPGVTRETQTEGHYVPDAEYQFQLQRIRQMQVLSLDYEALVGRMQVQLDAARGLVRSRSRAVKELREELFLENCRLRDRANQLMMKNSVRGDGSADRFVGNDNTVLHSSLNTILLGVERNRLVSSDGGQLEPTPEEELRKVKARAEDREAKLRRQLQETKVRCDLLIAKKDKQVRRIELANDVGKLRDVVIEQVQSVKADWEKLKQDARSIIFGAKTFIVDTAQELEYAIRRTAVEVSSFKEARANHQAIEDVLECMDELLTPVMKPEFATGSHPWPFARHADPLTFFIQQSRGDEVAERIGPEIRLLHNHYLNLQRFSLYMYQQPDQHSPQGGRVLINLAHRMLASPDCTNDLLAPIRNAIERDKSLAAQRARANLTLKFHSFRKAVIHQRVLAALKEADLDPEKEKLLSREPRRRADAAIARIKAMKAEIEEHRLQNANALYGLWRTTGIDLWDGKRAPVTRQFDATWTHAPGMSKARRTARLNHPSPSFVHSSKQPPPAAPSHAMSQSALLPPGTLRSD